MGGTSGSPVKEQSFLHRGESVDEQDDDVVEESKVEKAVPGRWS